MKFTVPPPMTIPKSIDTGKIHLNARMWHVRFIDDSDFTNRLLNINIWAPDFEPPLGGFSMNFEAALAFVETLITVMKQHDPKRLEGWIIPQYEETIENVEQSNGQ